MILIIRKGRVFDPGNYLDEVLDIYIEDGHIIEIGKEILERFPGLRTKITPERGDLILEAQGKLIVPGFIDLHTHLREPGFEYKETIETGTQAAAAGGFTTIACMANTSPVNDCRAVTEYIISQSHKHGVADVLPIGAITRGLSGETLSEIAELKSAGVVALSDDGKPVMSSLLMRIALEYARMFELPVISHCEDLPLAGKGVMNEGYFSTVLGLSGVPKAAEEIMVARDLALAELTKGHIHIAHASTKGTLRMISEARNRGVRVTCEVTPHHLTLTDESVLSFDTNTKVNPPLRSFEDVEALREGINNGTVDAIVTDHAPHALHEKDQEYDLAPFGMVGLETAVPLLFKLIQEGKLDLKRTVSALTFGPATVIKKEMKGLKAGAEAHISIIDLEKGIVIDSGKFKSKGRNTPFQGWSCPAKIDKTIRRGKIVFDGEKSE
ncbi:MAG: dihydroorotase [Candidatus Tectomicrobia bacterium]|uniref:Dihydroorotase n=1 Tax=Tectimicrobiota bacterium TaxID=2528274 RepID=A0A933GL70_UNCTE|nr:dihydroorotase [Candidatus Tectomicrobia bacterium]